MASQEHTSQTGYRVERLYPACGDAGFAWAAPALPEIGGHEAYLARVWVECGNGEVICWGLAVYGICPNAPSGVDDDDEDRELCVGVVREGVSAGREAARDIG